MLLPRPPAASRAGGVLRPWPAVLVTWGPGGQSKLHAHHCWHLVVGLDADLVVRTSARGRGRTAGALLSAPEVPHAVDARGTRALVVFLEPESESGERLARTRESGLELVSGADADRLRALLSPDAAALADPAAAVATALALDRPPAAPAPRRHPAVRRVLRHLQAAPPGADTSLAALAAVARLSPSRFMHAFTASVGVPLRPYLRWLALERAAGAIAGGASLGDAAHGAGFADAAHMTRTFREMFGVTPSEVRRRSQSVQDR